MRANFSETPGGGAQFLAPIEYPTRQTSVSTAIVRGTDYAIEVGGAGGAVAVTLPAGAAFGETYEIKNTDGAQPVTASAGASTAEDPTAPGTFAASVTIPPFSNIIFRWQRAGGALPARWGIV